MKRLFEQYSRSQILNMDETNIQLDSPSISLTLFFKFHFNFLNLLISFKANYTYDKKGSWQVKASTCGGERVKISLAFTAAANGKKLPLLIILSRKTPLKSFICPDNVRIIYKQRSKTLNSQIIKDFFFDKILRPYMLNHNRRKLILHLDNSPVHKKADVLNSFKKYRI